MADLRLTVGGIDLEADWTDGDPETTAAVRDALPLSGDATRWGDELYFGTEIDVRPEETSESVPEGAIAYWPAGNAVCLFWGPTPASTGDEPRAASPVAAIAQIDDPTQLEALEGGAPVRIERA